MEVPSKHLGQSSVPRRQTSPSLSPILLCFAFFGCKCQGPLSSAPGRIFCVDSEFEVRNAGFWQPDAKI